MGFNAMEEKDSCIYVIFNVCTRNGSADKFYCSKIGWLGTREATV